MISLSECQKRVIENKNFNVTNVEKEFCLLYGEVAEAYEAYRKKKIDLGEEIADVAIYLLGIAEILDKNLEEEILKKLEINENRKYQKVNGVNYKVEDKVEK